MIYTVRPCLIHTYPAVPLPCHEYAFQGMFVAGSWHGDGMVCPSRDGRFVAGSRHGDGMVRLETAGTQHVDEMLYCWRLASDKLHAATRGVPGRFVIRSISISDAGDQRERKQCLSWTRRSLLFWCKDRSACIIYGTKFTITI